MYKKIYAILFLYVSTHANAQLSEVVFDHYGLEAGFYSREAMDIETTSNGMIWISSNDGLARFDGKRFKFYQHSYGDSNSLSNNYCKSIQTDKRDRIWICSDDNLDVFDPATEKFAHIKIKDRDNEERPVFPLSFYYDAAADIMWVGTTRGLYFCKNGSLIIQSAAILTRENQLTNSVISSISQEGTEFLWITSGRYIIKMSIRSGNTEKYELPHIVDNIINAETVGFRCSYLDNSKTLWLGTWLTGLVEFNTITKEFHQYCFSDYTRQENTILDIEQTNQPGQENLLWLSADKHGLTTFNMQAKKFTSFISNQGYDPFGVKGSTYGLFPDKENAMWIGSATGLHRYDYNKQLFKVLDISSIGKGTSFPAVNSMAMQKTKSGIDEMLWLYLPYRGGYLYHLAEKKIIPLPHKAAAYINLPVEFLDFYIDSKNICWISSVQHGLTGYAIDKDEIIFSDDKLFKDQRKWVSCFYEDRKKRLWIGTYHGLYMMDSSRKNIIAAEAVNNELNKNKLSLAIAGITEDETGNILFIADVTDAKKAAVGKLNVANNQIQIVYNETEQKQVNQNPVGLRSIVCNPAGKIFVSFYGEGIAVFNNTGSAILPDFLNSKSGLNSNFINELIPDSYGNIWCSTSFGLSSYNTSQNIFTNYSYISYALDNTQEPVIYLSSQSGNMYVGQSGAIRWFSTAIKNVPVTKSQLVFSAINVLNKTYNTTGSIIKDGDIVKLNYRQDMISVEFALLSYTNAADNTYSWMLKGWDKEWNVSKSNIASYTNLKPGTYTLLVKAANSQGEWIKDPIQLIIKIKPPFHQTWWFISLCLLATAGITYWVIQQRINRIKERYRLRNKIAADLHDEIGSTLTSISILSNVSQQAMEQQPQQAKEMLQQISTQSKSIQQNMSDIVWSIRPDNEKIENLLARMREYAAQTLEPLDIKIIIEANESLISKSLPMECRKELLLIYKEAINNIAKHAGATLVTVSFAGSNNQLQLSIKDNGKWKGDSSGTGTKSMKDRAHAVGGKLSISINETGTVVAVSIPVP